MKHLKNLWYSYISFGERNFCLAPDEESNDIEYWRTRLFSRILLFIIPVSFIAYITGLVMAIIGNIPIVAITNTLVFLTLLSTTTIRRIPLHVKKIIFLALVYVLSIILILFIGFRGPGFLFLLVTSVLASLLFNSRTAYLTLFLNVLIFSILLLGLLFDFQNIPFFTEYTFGTWTAVGTSFLLVNSVLVYSITSLINGLQKTISNEKKLKTSLKIESKKLRIAKERALKSAKMKSAFLANMSHEIRTPLNSIVGFANILLDNKNPENQKLYIDVINKSSEQLLSLINDIINFSKIDAGAINIENKSIKLTNFLTTIAAAMKALCPANLEFIYKFEIQNKDEMVFIDDQKVTQIISNLITNSFKYTQEGQVEFKATISEDKSTIQFIIKDTGIGIPKEKQYDVFERFFQENSTSEGVGLGLSISNALIKALNGKIHLESEPGKGTTFFISIPNKTLKSGAKPETIDLENLWINGHIQNGFRKIIVAEDNDENFEIIKEVLYSSNLEIIRAINGKEAVELSSNDHFDLILMDIKMPILDGFEATRQIRKFNSKIPIIAVTANAFNADKEKAIKAGCNDFVTKPIDFNQLSKVLSRYSKLN